jgi:hypothetical protein
MPELTEHEVRVLARARYPVWVGLFWMVLGGLNVVLGAPKHASGVALALWLVFLVVLIVGGFIWYVWATRRELERGRVLSEIAARPADSRASILVPRKPVIPVDDPAFNSAQLSSIGPYGPLGQSPGSTASVPKPSTPGLTGKSTAPAVEKGPETGPSE